MGFKYGSKYIYKKLRHSHVLMMLICCGIPLLLLYVAVYLLGLSNSYLYWAIIFLCPLMHLWMMRGMHKDGKESCH